MFISGNRDGVIVSVQHISINGATWHTVWIALAVLGTYGNVNVVPPSLTDQPTKVSLPRVGGSGADISSPCNTTPGAIADPPLLV